MAMTTIHDIDTAGALTTVTSIGSVLSSFVLAPEWQGIAYILASVSGAVAIVLGIVRIYYTIKHKGRSKGDE